MNNKIGWIMLTNPFGLMLGWQIAEVTKGQGNYWIITICAIVICFCLYKLFK